MNAEEQALGNLELWTQVRAMVDDETRHRVGQLVDKEAAPLALLFYEAMFSDPRLAPLLDHDLVNRRLNASMMRWLRMLFDPASAPPDLERLQRHVGEVHARIGVSHVAVASAGRVLKRAIASALRTRAALADAAGALQYVYELVDIAIDAMTDSLTQATTRLTRTDESYRLHVLTQNLRAERERQKTHLVEWIQQLLLKHYWIDPDADEPPDASRLSHFELWIEHKADMLFEDHPELQAVRGAMRRVTASLLPALQAARDEPAQARAIVARIHLEGTEMKQLLGTLFDRASAAEDGRDPLTQLLSRRYVPSIVKREIGLSQAGGRPFSLLMLDIDGFSDMARATGAATADQVLAQVADALGESVRSSDFVFRIGDDQFLVLLVEADRAAALRIADGLRQTVEDLRIRTAADLTPQVTVCVGVATHEGHPDYEHLLRRAEAALAGAKAAGRNRVVEAAADA